MKKFFPAELVLVYLVFLILQILTFRTGVGIEEFRTPWVLQQMNLGHMPFRDFIWEYGVLGPLLWFGAAKIVGMQFLAMRIVVIVLTIPCIWMSCRIARRFAPRWPAAFIALAANGILTFPTYSYEHALSVPFFLAAILTAIRYFETKRQKFLLISAFFSAVTILIRPIPTGIVLPAAVFLTAAALSIKDKNADPLKNGAIYIALTAAEILLFTTGYTMLLQFPSIRWANLNLVSPYVYWGSRFDLVTPPNSFHDIIGFIRDRHLTGGALSIRFSTLLSLLSSHLADWIAFILPAIYLVYAIIALTQGKLNETKFLLAILAVPLGLFFHLGVKLHTYPDILNFGSSWSQGAFFILVPGLLLGLGIVYQQLMRMRLQGTLTVVMIAFLLIAFPKILNLRYFFIPMKSVTLPPVGGILLNDYYRQDVIPAAEFLNENQTRLPKSLFSPRPEFQVLSPQAPAFPEFYYIANLPDNFPIKPGLWPGLDNSQPITIGQFMIDRLESVQPIVVLDFEISDGPKEWMHYIFHHYRLYRKFSARNRLGISTAVCIYLPKKYPAYF